MISINNATLSGRISEAPKRYDLEETNTTMVVFKVKNEMIINSQRKTQWNITVKCFGNVAEYVDATLSYGDKVLVSGTIACSSQMYRGGYVNMPYIRALGVTNLEQEQYK